MTPEVAVVMEVSPSVVFIETSTPVDVPRRNFFRTWIERREASGTGSGVVLFDEGYIITNYHVVSVPTPQGRRPAGTIRVRFDPSFDGQVYDADLISAVPEEDLALLKIQGEHPFPTVRMGTSSDLMTGERVVAIGNPYGQSNTVSAGIISGQHRDVDVDELSFTGLIQTDASINPGNSGGPLLNITGELIGINTAMNFRAENIGFAIPVNRVKKVLEDHLFDVASAPGWIGFDVAAGGLAIERVIDGSPASAAGLRPGDRLVSLGGQELSDHEEYRRHRLAALPGRQVELGVLRDGEVERLSVEPWTRVDAVLHERLGLAVGSVTIPAGYRTIDFLRVSGLRAGGPAQKLGLREGDLIESAGPGGRRNARVRTPEDLALAAQRMAAGESLELELWRDEDGDGNLVRSPEYSEFFRGRLVLE
jgi:serine protease Do